MNRIIATSIAMLISTSALAEVKFAEVGNCAVLDVIESGELMREDATFVTSEKDPVEESAIENGSVLVHGHEWGCDIKNPEFSDTANTYIVTLECAMEGDEFTVPGLVQEFKNGFRIRSSESDWFEVTERCTELNQHTSTVPGQLQEERRR